MVKRRARGVEGEREHESAGGEAEDEGEGERQRPRAYEGEGEGVGEHEYERVGGVEAWVEGEGEARVRVRVRATGEDGVMGVVTSPSCALPPVTPPPVSPLPIVAHRATPRLDDALWSDACSMMATCLHEARRQSGHAHGNVLGRAVRGWMRTLTCRKELAIHGARLQDNVVRRDGLYVLRVKPHRSSPPQANENCTMM